MADFLLFCFATVGMTLILVNGSIFQSFRDSLNRGVENLQQLREKKGISPSFTLLEFFHSLIHCPQCMGFWSGLFCGLFLLTSDTFALEKGSSLLLFNRLFMFFCCGAAGSFLSMFADFLLNWLFFSKLYFERQISFDETLEGEKENDNV